MQRFDIAGGAGDGQGPAPPQEIGQGRERQKSCQKSCWGHGGPLEVRGSGFKVHGSRLMDESDLGFQMSATPLAV